MNYSDNELIYMIKEDESALSTLIKKYEPLYRKLSFSFLQKYDNVGIDIDDLIQQCRIATCYALECYNSNKDVKFFSYLVVCLNRAIRNYARYFVKDSNVSYYSYDFLNNLSTKEDVYDSILEIDILDTIKKFTLNLKFVDSCIFELRMNNFSYSEIAKLLDIKVKKVDNSLLRSRKKLEKILKFIY